MSCSVAVSNSPVFSPSSSLFCNNKTPALISPSPAETLTLTLTHLKASQAPSSSSSPSSPCSPLRLRLQKPPSALPFSTFASTSTLSQSASGTVLKRKRPTRLDIPVTAFGFRDPMTPAVEKAEMERDGSVYSVCCKRGRREAMEDRFSAVLDLQGDTKQVSFLVFVLILRFTDQILKIFSLGFEITL